jgi:hypothetical protein
MKEAIKRMHDKRGITVPRGLLSDPAKAKAYLDENLKGGDDSSAPSQASLDYATNLLKLLPSEKTPPADWQTSRKACSELIEMAKPYQAPSPKARAFAEKLLGEMPEPDRPAPGFLDSASKVSDFIDKQMSKSKSKGGGSGSKSAPAKRKAPAKSRASTAKRSAPPARGASPSRPRQAPSGNAF